ncbi:MAG: DUF2892 domain-containing protein [Vicinamibacterales bacterium]
MKQNMGATDRTLRAIVAVGVGILYVAGAISGTVALLVGALAIVFLATSAVGWCPIYGPLGISTRR